MDDIPGGYCSRRLQCLTWCKWAGDISQWTRSCFRSWRSRIFSRARINGQPADSCFWWRGVSSYLLLCSRPAARGRGVELGGMWHGYAWCDGQTAISPVRNNCDFATSQHANMSCAHHFIEVAVDSDTLVLEHLPRRGVVDLFGYAG